MRTFRVPKSLAAFVAMAAIAASTPASQAADRNGAQLEVAGLFGVPSGSFTSAGGASLSDYFASGPGFHVFGTLGMSRHLHAGVRYGVFRGEKDGTLEFSDLGPAGSSLAGSGPFDAARRLTTSEFAGVLQYRRAAGASAQWYVEAGGGLLTFVERVQLSTGGTDLLAISGYQQDPMWTAGAGVSFRVRRNFDLVCGARWLQALSSEGDVWAEGDDPSFLEASLGLRYPNYAK